MSSTHIVFVYGSLRRGCGNHRLLRDAKPLGDARTEARYTMRSLGSYPGVSDDGITAIRGEAYEVDDAQLAALDRLEGHPRFYRRSTIRLDGGLEAWIYLLPFEMMSRQPIVPSGDWVSYLNRNEDELCDSR